MFYNNINPTLLKIGIFEIRYYGVIFVLGFIIAYYFLIHLSKQRGVGLNKEDISDYLLYLVLGVVLGARVFYVLFYNFGYFLDNPLNIFAVWKGGLSFHGGLVGSVVSTYIFCRRKKIYFYDLADMLVIPVSLALMLGRIGNFINGELVGRVTNVPWAVKFKNYEGFRHPSQIYESLKNLLMFIVLINVKDRKFPRGFLFWLFVTMYSFLRFFIGFYRAPDVQLGFILFGLTMGQLLNIAMFVIGTGFLYKIYRKKEN